METDVTFFKMTCGNHMYIGKTKNFYRLKQIYESSLQRNSFNEPMQTAYHQNNNCVQFEIIARRDIRKDDIADLIDQYRMEEIQKGFFVVNPTRENNGRKGIRRATTTKEKIANSLKKRWGKDGDLRRIHTDRIVSSETKKKISDGVKRYRQTLEKDTPKSN